MKLVTITLVSDQSEDEINKVMEKMLWDSEFSYEFENANWIIEEDTWEEGDE
jgi:hypothetical protein